MRALFDGGVLVGEFVFTKALNNVFQLGIDTLEFIALVTVVLLNHFLDRLSARVRRFFADERSDGAQAKASYTPNRRHERWPHTPFSNQTIERLQMLLLASFHLGDELCGVRLALDPAEHGFLAAINLDCAILARVINTDHFIKPALLDILTRHRRTGPAHCSRFPASAT